VGEFVSTMNGDNSCPINPLATHEVYFKGNMESISTTFPIDFSKTPSIMENVFFEVECSAEYIRTYSELFKEFREFFSWYYEEIL
jgi:hypothetical protein